MKTRLKDLRFTFHNVGPLDTSAIINKINKLFCSRNTFYNRSPNIRMNKGEWETTSFTRDGIR